MAIEQVRRGARMPRVARRAQLLQAAREVFVDKGYHAAAMDDIAERAGVSKPVLYQHFPGKRELYLALLDLELEGLTQALLKALASSTDNKERVRATMEAYFEFVDDDRQAFRLVFESDLIGDEGVRQRIDHFNHEHAKAVSEIIREDAGLPEAESMLLAAAMTGAAQTSARYWLSREGALPRDLASSLVARMVWRGIGGFPLREG